MVTARRPGKEESSALAAHRASATARSSFTTVTRFVGQPGSASDATAIGGNGEASHPGARD